MLFTTSTFLAILAATASARPTEKAIVNDVSFLDSVLLLDAPAYYEGLDLKATFRAHTFSRFSIKQSSSLLVKALKALDIIVGGDLSTVLDRTKLFFVDALEGKTVDLKTPKGCLDVSVGETEDGGFVEQQVSLGQCGDGGVEPKIVLADLGMLDSRGINATVFPSTPYGFGIISDIDDTIKQSFVLHPLKAAKMAFLEPFIPVDGMPQLHQVLKTKLQNPLALYVSGSPVQFYPFLQPFIKQNFIPGPITLKNFTLDTIPEMLDFGGVTRSDIFEFKTTEIEKIFNMFPAKQFVAMGDSTQKDPEVYSTIFKRHPGFIQCIWIRQVDDANNTAARFESAFEGVPVSKIKVFQDPSELMSLDPQNGVCN